MRSMITALATRWRTALGSGAILLFFSEYYFLNEGPVQTVIDAESFPALAGSVFGLLAWYSLFGYLLAWIDHRYTVRSPTRMLLAGALVGWAIEALVVPVAYEAIPVSFIWPSVGWHAFVDVLVGWYLLPDLIARRPAIGALALIALGLFWGLWATWLAPGGVRLTLVEFATVVAVSSSVWLLGGSLLAGERQAFEPGRVEAGVIRLIVIALAVLQASLILPLSLLLVPLAWLTFTGMRQSRHADASKRERRHGVSSLQLLTPAVAIAAYGGVLALGFTIDVELVTSLAFVTAAITFAWSLVRAFTLQPRQSSADSLPAAGR